jgi:glycosyltransferase involved in cell wall biosynthesis
VGVEVSVIIPSYNHAAYLAEAVTSVLNQTAGNLELIMVDDGSTDNSLALLQAIADPRLKIIAQANQGAHAAINRGVAEADGEYLAILNSDDVYHPQRLEKLVAVLKNDPTIGLAGSHIEVIDSRGKSLGVKHGYRDLSPWPLPHPERSFRAGDSLHEALLTENFYATTSNFVFRRSWYEQVGPFLPLRYTHDWDFALRMARAAKLTMVPEPLLQYRVHDSNTIRENRTAMIFEICWILAVHLPQQVGLFEGQPQEYARKIEQLLHSIYTFDADRVLNILLLQQIGKNPQLASRLLEPTDPIRAKYIKFLTDLQVR